MAAVAKYKKGELPDAPQDIKDAAKGMTSGEVDDFANTDTKGLPDKVEEADEKRDYAKEYQARKSYYYDKYQSSDKAKKYRAELNKYNRDKGTYGNGDKKDASHKGGKIVGFEAESKNRSRKEKSRLKKENSMNEAVKMEFKIGDLTVGKDNGGISTQNFGIRYYYQKPKGAKHMESDLGKFMVSLGNMVSSSDKAKITKRLKESTQEQILRTIIRKELKEAMKSSSSYGYTKDGIVQFKGSKADSTKKAAADQKKNPKSKYSIFMSHSAKVGDKYGQKNEIDLPANLHLRRHQQGVVGDMS